MRSVRRVKEIGSLPKKVLKHLSQRKFLTEIGELVSLEIVKRARQGFGATADNKKYKRFAPLRPSTIKRRTFLKSIGKLSSLTKPTKSNLTETGQMLDNVSYSVNAKGVVIFVKDKKDDKGVSAKTKAAYHHKDTRRRRARPFMFVASVTIRKARRILEDARDTYIRSLI